MQLVLEPRFLFDASVAAVAKPVTHAFNHDSDPAGGNAHANSPGHNDGTLANSTGAASDLTNAGQAAQIPGLAPNPAATELLFVDPRVSNWQALAAGVNGNVQVVVLNPAKDAIDQVTRALDSRSGITAINFLAYGTPGTVEMGATPLSAASLASHATEISSWSDHLTANADIMFWSCDVAQGASGQALLADLHTLTGAQVAASSDAVGAGAWTLDATTGPIDAPMPFSSASLEAYHGVLDSPVPTVTINGSAAALPGGTFSETVTLTNGAANAAGDSPFVEVFAPANATENASLVAATENGQALSVTAVTLNADASGHIVAIDPMVRDANGNAQAVAAPAGYQAGDLMYVVRLAPAALAAGASEPVALTFSLSGSSAPTTTGLEIAAIGGFQNDGMTVRGTSPAEGNLATDAGNGLVLADPGVAYVSAEAQVTYVAADNGLAAGLYQLTVTSAPVLSQKPMQGLEFDVALPSNATYTGGSITLAGIAAAGATATVVPGGSAGGQELALDFPIIAAGGVTTIQVPLTVPETGAPETSGIPSSADPSSGPFTGIYPLGGNSGNTATYAATDWAGTTQTISLPQFDTTLGTLNDAQLSFTGYINTTGSITATTPVLAEEYTLTEAMNLITPGAALLSSNALITINPAIFSLPTGTVVNPGTPVTVGPLQSNDTQTTTITTGLATYEGAATVTFPLLATTSASVNLFGGNLSASLTTSALATASITYDYTAAIVTPATFNAHVYTDSNANSTQDGGEPSLSGVTVNLLNGAGTTTLATATTDASGNVSFTNLTPGSYEVSVVTPGGDTVTQQTNVATPTTLTAGETVNAIEGVYAPATFDAHVYTDSNANSTQDGGEPSLSGVTVKLLNGAGTTTLATATTDASGNVSFTGLIPGTYEVSVVTPGGDSVSQQTNVATPATLTSGETANAIEGVYAPASFAAHVYTDTNADSTQNGGEPNLSGVTVNLLNGAGTTTLATATTDASGNVNFTGLTPGSYEVSVVTPGGDTVTQHTNVLTPTILASGGTANAIEGLTTATAGGPPGGPATSNFTAHVYVDSNGNSTQDPGEPNQPGITVQLLNGSGVPTGQTAVTDANGNVTFTGLTPGTYEIAVVAPAGDSVTQQTNVATPITLAPGASVNAIEGLFVPAAVTAHVYADVNGNSTQDPGEPNEPGVTVELLTSTGVPTGKSAVTDANGNVSFTGLVPGTYEIAVVTPSGDSVTQATNIGTPVTVASGVTVNAIEGLFGPATFNAHVYDDLNGNSTQDSGEPNLAGITVQLLNGSGVPTGRTAVTDANGNVSFAGLTPGSYEIAVLAPAGESVTQQTNVGTPVTLVVGQSATAIEGIFAPATFNAHVYADSNDNSTQDPGEPNEPGVTVQLLTGSGVPTGKTAVTDANGNVSFTGLAPGSYEIAVVTPAGDSVTQATNIGTPIVLAPGGTSTAIEGIFGPATFNAHVYTDTNGNSTQDPGEPNLAGVTVELLTGSGVPTGKTAVTDVNGNVTFTGLPPGTYEIAVVTPNGDVVTQATNILTPVTLGPAQIGTSVEGVYGPATLTAHVYDDTNKDGVQESGEPNLPGIIVELLDGSGNPTGRTAVTDVNGNVTFTGLPPGTYRIGVVTPAADTITQATNIGTPLVLAAGQTIQGIEGVVTGTTPILAPQPPQDPENPVGPQLANPLLIPPIATPDQSLGDFYLYDGTAQARQLYVEARNSDGGPIPNWLVFDPTTMSFSGSPPVPLTKALVMIVVIRDSKGNQTFHDVPVVTGPSGDVTTLYDELTSQSFRDLIRSAFARQGQTDISPHPLSESVLLADDASVSPVDSGHDGSFEGRSAFTTQLHAAGRMGRLAEARALLDLWAGLDRQAVMN
jgi:protocatechuate 3,4-dioxygenase beta subunit